MTQGISDNTYSSSINRYIGRDQSEGEKAAAHFGDQLDSIERALDMLYASGDMNAVKENGALLGLLRKLGFNVTWSKQTQKDGSGKETVEEVASFSLGGLREALSQKWQRVSTAFQGFLQLTRARFELLREGIRNLSVR